MARIDFTTFLLFVVTASSQTTQCVWNSIDEWDHLNGEYTNEGTFDNGDGVYPYWRRWAPTCSDTDQYIFAAYHDKDKISYWQINPQLVQTSLTDIPDCGEDWDQMPADPSQCVKGWSVWQDDKKFTSIPLTVTDTTCPLLPCNRIQVSNAGVAACNKIFDRDYSQDNVFKKVQGATTTYLYFNPYTFKWHCSYTLDHTYCGDEASLNVLLSSKKDGWNQVSLGESFEIRMDDDIWATFDCLEGTTPPSKSPTADPTKAPSTSPTPKPTLNPTPQPTNNPSTNPTTPAPTPPGTLVCGESDTGDYNGEFLTFMVSLPHRGDIMFDASYSWFQITAMEATSELGTVLLGTDHDNDEVIRLYDMPPGNYKFSIYGGTVTNVQYEVRTWCSSFDPTMAPSQSPTKPPTSAPTKDPTPAPSSAPTQSPTSAPTANPTKFPTIPPTKNPTKFPTKSPTNLPSIPPTKYPTNYPSISPTFNPTLEPTFPTKAPLVDTTLESGDGQNKVTNSTDLGTVLIIMVCAALVLFIWLIAIWAVYFRKKRVFLLMESSDAMKDREEPKDTFAMRVAADTSDNIEMIQGEAASNNAIYRKKKALRKEVLNQQSNAMYHKNIVAADDVIAGVKDEDDTTDSSVDDGMFGTMPKQKTIGTDAQCKDKMRGYDRGDERFGEININANDPEPFGNNANQPGFVVGDAGDVDMGMCNDCTLFRKGRVYEGDGLFYCDQCWNSY